MIDLNLIYTFIEIARTKNLRIVAQKLSITQPALSQRVRLLEGQVGKSLFLRKKGMELNAAGKELFELCGNYLKDISSIDNWVKSQKKSIEGRVSIETTYGPVSYLFPDFLKKFTEKYPEVFVTCKSVEASQAVEDDVLAGKIDMGMIVGTCQKVSLKTQRLLENNFLYMVCSPKYCLAGKSKITKDDLLSARLILHADNTSRTMRKIFRHIGIHYHHAGNILLLPDMESCKRHAMKGLGVTFVAKMYLLDELRSGALVALPGFEMKSAMNLISRSDKYEAPAVTVFKREFVGYCQILDKSLKG